MRLWLQSFRYCRVWRHGKFPNLEKRKFLKIGEPESFPKPHILRIQRVEMLKKVPKDRSNWDFSRIQSPERFLNGRRNRDFPWIRKAEISKNRKRCEIFQNPKAVSFQETGKLRELPRIREQPVSRSPEGWESFKSTGSNEFPGTRNAERILWEPENSKFPEIWGKRYPRFRKRSVFKNPKDCESFEEPESSEGSEIRKVKGVPKLRKRQFLKTRKAK